MRGVRMSAAGPVLALLAGLLVSGPSQGADAPNVILIGEDGGRDMIPRSSGVFKIVRDGLGNRLLDGGFSVYDETAVAPGGFIQDRKQRSDAEIIEMARAIGRPPLDVAVIFSVTARAREYAYTTKVGTRMTGRLLNLTTGQRLGSFEVRSPRALRAATDCGRDCILELVGRSAKRLSRDLGTLVAERLTAVMEAPPLRAGAGLPAVRGLRSAYTLVFDGFSRAEVSEMEEYLVVFTGYAHHRPVSAGPRHQEYWYETKSTRGRLHRNLGKMLEHLRLGGQVSLAGNTFTVRKAAPVREAAAREPAERRWDDW
ncbi:MAG: hypothetical protein V3S45_03680 [Kiloniellales bacterium]